jgi:hypothetical protein
MRNFFLFLSLSLSLSLSSYWPEGWCLFAHGNDSFKYTLISLNLMERPSIFLAFSQSFIYKTINFLIIIIMCWILITNMSDILIELKLSLHHSWHYFPSRKKMFLNRKRLDFYRKIVRFFHFHFFFPELRFHWIKW